MFLEAIEAGNSAQGTSELEKWTLEKHGMQTQEGARMLHPLPPVISLQVAE